MSLRGACTCDEAVSLAVEEIASPEKLARNDIYYKETHDKLSHLWILQTLTR